MNKKQTISIAVIVIVVGIIIYFLNQKPHGNVSAVTPVTSTTTQTGGDDTAQYAGTTTVNAQGDNIYTNSKIGITLTYPKGWHIGSNALGYGALQFFNYDESAYSGKGFAPDTDASGVATYQNINKIEAAIVSENTYGTSSPDAPQKTRTHTETTINGQKVNRYDVEFTGGEKLRIYYIPVSNKTDQYLGIVIYGNPANFSVLDTLVKSIQFVK